MLVGQKGKSNVLIRKNLKRSREEFEEEQKNIYREIIINERDKLEMEVENLMSKIKEMKDLEELYLIDREAL